MKNEKNIFYVINEEGIKQEAEILTKFKLINGLNYIVYTYGEINDNDMIKIYSTGIEGTKGNYSYKKISTTTEWDEIKNILKILAKEDTTSLPEENKNDLRILGEEISVRDPKKLLVSNKFAKTVASKYEEPKEEKKVEEDNEVTKFNIPLFDIPKIETPEPIAPLPEPEPKVELPEPEPVEKIETAKINVPTFEELQARSKKVTEVIESAKSEEEERPIEKPMVKKENYAEKFKSEVEPVLLDVYSRQQAQIDALEEELSKTKFDLFEEQKLSLSLKTANKELTEKENKLQDELKDAKSKVEGIMDLLQGTKN